MGTVQTYRLWPSEIPAVSIIIPTKPINLPNGRGLRRAASKLPTPTDYFAGTNPHGAAVPFNVLVFARRSWREMQPRDAFRHRRFVLALNLGTPGAIALGRRWLPVGRGEGILVFPNQVHAFGRFRSNEVSWLFVTFELDDLAWLEILRATVWRCGPKAMRWLDELVRDWSGHSPGSATAAPYLTALVLHELKRQLARQGADNRAETGPEPAPATVSPSFVLPRVQAVIEQGPPTGGLKALAIELGVSESHLRAEFRKQSGRSLGRYLREARLKQAAQLLAGTRQAIGEVAHSCGFNSADAFARAFRRAVGTTPREYRQRGRSAG